MSIQVISLTEHSFCFSRDDACSVLVTTSSKHLSVSRAHFCTENSILIQYYGRKKVCWVSLKLLPFPKLYPAKYFLFFSTLLSCCLVSCWVRPIIGIIKRLKQKKKMCEKVKELSLHTPGCWSLPCLRWEAPRLPWDRIQEYCPHPFPLLS